MPYIRHDDDDDRLLFPPPAVTFTDIDTDDGRGLVDYIDIEEEEDHAEGNSYSTSSLLLSDFFCNNNKDGGTGGNKGASGGVETIGMRMGMGIITNKNKCRRMMRDHNHRQRRHGDDDDQQQQRQQNETGCNNIIATRVADDANAEEEEEEGEEGENRKRRRSNRRRDFMMKQEMERRVREHYFEREQQQLQQQEQKVLTDDRETQTHLRSDSADNTYLHLVQPPVLALPVPVSVSPPSRSSPDNNTSPEQPRTNQRRLTTTSPVLTPSATTPSTSPAAAGILVNHHRNRRRTSNHIHIRNNKPKLTFNEPQVPVAKRHHGLVGIPDEMATGRAVHHVESTWERGEDLYLFGYGSLMFYTSFKFKSWTPVYIKGYRRALTMGSEHHRGVPGNPGRVFNLEFADPDEVTTGILFRIGVEDAPRAWELLNTREAGYLKLQVPCFLFDRHQRKVHRRFSEQPVYLRTTIFIATPEADAYLGDASSTHALAKTVAYNSGPAGTNAEYVLRTTDTLRTLGMLDHGMEPDLEAVEREVKRLLRLKGTPWVPCMPTHMQQQQQLTQHIQQKEGQLQQQQRVVPVCHDANNGNKRKPDNLREHPAVSMMAAAPAAATTTASPTARRHVSLPPLLPFPATQLCTCMMRRVAG